MDHLWTPWRYAYIQEKGPDAGAETAGRPPRRGVPSALSAWPGDHGCVFCNVLAAVDYMTEHGMPREEAEAAGGILERSRLCFILLNAFPYNNGHLMIVPYRHEASLANLPLEAALEIMSETRRAERALRAVYQPEGMNIGVNLGQHAGAGIAEHLHVHVVPRWSGDTNYMTVIGETRVLPEMLTDSWRRLRQAFRADSIERQERGLAPGTTESSLG